MALLERDVRNLDSWPDRCARCLAEGTSAVPVPKKYADGIVGLTVPLCPTHADDWAVVRSKSRVGTLVILGGMAVTAAVVWFVQPEVARPQDQNANSRWLATIMLGLVSAFPLGMAMLAWAKTPIRVLQRQGRLFTIAGVSAAFATLIKRDDVPAPLPDVPDAARFEVALYRPLRRTPFGVFVRLLTVTVLSATLLGGMVGWAGQAIGQLTAGWGPNDGAYLGCIAGVTAAYLIPQFGLWDVATTRFGVVGVGVMTAVVVLASLVARQFGLPLEKSFAGIFGGGPLLYLTIAVTGRYVWRWRVRTRLAAGTVGVGGPLLLAGVAFLIAGHDPGPHSAMPWIAGLFALLGGVWNLHIVRTPFCNTCDGWLGDRRVGALARSKREMVAVVSAGEIVSLAGVEPYTATATPGDVELHVHTCPVCREGGTVVVELFEASAGGKNKKQVSLLSAGRWLYPGESLPVIEKLFPPPRTGDPQA